MFVSGLGLGLGLMYVLRAHLRTGFFVPKIIWTSGLNSCVDD